MGIGFDTAFVFTEVNADVVVYVKDPASSWGFRKSDHFDLIGVLMITSMLIPRFLVAVEAFAIIRFIIYITRGLGALWAPTSSLRPFGPAFGPSGLLDFVLRALRALRPCDPRNSAFEEKSS